jgi:hypothetical protein
VSAHSGADGDFVVAGLSTGKYVISARGADRPATGIEAGASDVVVELPATGEIAGDLRGFRAPPVVKLRGERDEGRADVVGTRFALAGVSIGTHEVTALSSIGELAVERVTVAAEKVSRVTLTASATGTLEGTVIDLRTRAPVAGVHCMWSAGATGLGRPVETDATGDFSVPAPAGTIEVQCFGRAVETARHVSATVAPGATAHVVVELVEFRGRERRGKVGVALDSAAGGAHRVQALYGGAASSGLRVGDVLLAVDGLAVAGMREHVVYRLLIGREIGEPARLTVEREGAQLAFDVVVEADL